MTENQFLNYDFPHLRKGLYWDDIESKIVLRTTKFPHLRKGRYRDDIFLTLCKCHPERREGNSEGKQSFANYDFPHLRKGLYWDDSFTAAEGKSMTPRNEHVKSLIRLALSS